MRDKGRLTDVTWGSVLAESNTTQVNRLVVSSREFVGFLKIAIQCGRRQRSAWAARAEGRDVRLSDLARDNRLVASSKPRRLGAGLDGAEQRLACGLTIGAMTDDRFEASSLDSGNIGDGDLGRHRQIAGQLFGLHGKSSVSDLMGRIDRFRPDQRPLTGTFRNRFPLASGSGR